MPPLPKRLPIVPDLDKIKETARELVKGRRVIFYRTGNKNSVQLLIEVAELLNWPIITTPQAKGYIPEEHPLLVGVFGFAGHEAASALINEGDGKALLIVGSSLGKLRQIIIMET